MQLAMFEVREVTNENQSQSRISSLAAFHIAHVAKDTGKAPHKACPPVQIATVRFSAADP